MGFACDISEWIYSIYEYGTEVMVMVMVMVMVGLIACMQQLPFFKYLIFNILIFGANKY
jgi:hypothetical protein